MLCVSPWISEDKDCGQWSLSVAKSSSTIPLSSQLLWQFRGQSSTCFWRSGNNLTDRSRPHTVCTAQLGLFPTPRWGSADAHKGFCSEHPFHHTAPCWWLLPLQPLHANTFTLVLLWEYCTQPIQQCCKDGVGTLKDYELKKKKPTSCRCLWKCQSPWLLGCR